MDTFPAFRIHSRDGHIVAGLERMTLGQLTPVASCAVIR